MYRSNRFCHLTAPWQRYVYARWTGISYTFFFLFKDVFKGGRIEYGRKKNLFTQGLCCSNNGDTIDRSSEGILSLVRSLAQKNKNKNSRLDVNLGWFLWVTNNKKNKNIDPSHYSHAYLLFVILHKSVSTKQK